MMKGSCKHYKGMHGCALGVDLRALVGGDNFGWRRRIPCNVGTMAGSSLAAIDPVPCELYEEPTAEEIAKSEADLQSAVEAFRAVERGDAAVPCPKCGETLGPGGCPAGCRGISDGTSARWAVRHE